MKQAASETSTLKHLFVVTALVAALMIAGSPADAQDGGSLPAPAASAQAANPGPSAIPTKSTPEERCLRARLKHLPKSGMCTHGPDTPPPGVSVAADVAPVSAQAAAAATFTCVGDGTSGPRVEVIYARSSDVADQYAPFVASIQSWASAADTIYDASAAETGGSRHIRFVHDSSCVPPVRSAVLSATGDDTFDDTVTELQAAGYNRTDRKYMVFVDANVYCGIGGLYGDDQSSPSNPNNGGPSYSRTDRGCWGGPVVAHELTHNLGGVQLSAPNSSGGFHCTDENDVMCYADSSTSPAVRYLCEAAHETRLDCGHDDYFSTAAPPGSYLDTHWNVADSSFLHVPAAPPDTTAPTLTGRTPAVAATAVATPANTTATFSEPVTGLGPTTFTLRNAAGTTVPGAVSYDAAGRVATLNPTADLAVDRRYTATLTGGAAAVRDTAGNPLATTTWSFLTGPRPTVIARSPAAGATAVGRTANVTATFGEPVTGVSSTRFTLRNTGTGAAVSAAVSRSGTTNRWILDPGPTLAGRTRYTVTLTGGTSAIRDLAGNPLGSVSWTFTTGG